MDKKVEGYWSIAAQKHLKGFTTEESLICPYFLILFGLLFILMFLFMKDKVTFKRRIINKQKGFLLEKAHIVLFENLPLKISSFINFLDEKIVQNVFPFVVEIINKIISLFVIKFKRKDKIKHIQAVLIIFAIFAILAIFIALFGRYKV